MSELTVAACNALARPVSEFDEFAAHVTSLLDRAAGADIVVLPELLTLELATGGEDAPDYARLAKHTDAYRELFSRQAADRGQCVVAGSHVTINGGRALNVAHLFTPGGELHPHAKTHVVTDEHAAGIGEGDTMDVVRLRSATVGVLVCYEAEFPECAQELAERGAQVLLCPSLTHTEHGFWRVRHCLHARCVEHQVFAVHAGLAGDPAALPGGGYARSAVLGPCDSAWAPNGILAETASNVEGVAIARLDLDELESSRGSCPAPTHRDRRRRADLHEAWRAGRGASVPII